MPFSVHPADPFVGVDRVSEADACDQITAAKYSRFLITLPN